MKQRESRIRKELTLREIQQRREVRTFVIRFVLLFGLILLVGWAGWFAPWSRADARVTVEVVKE